MRTISRDYVRRVVVTAAAGLIAGTGIAAAATRPQKQGPTVRIEPSPSNLDYGQTVRVIGENLKPKGTGYTAITICGVTDDNGKPLANPGRDDCAGTDEIGDLLIVVANDDGRIDERYTLPKKGRRFAKNHRQCNTKTQCVLVVADAAASGTPAYQVSKTLKFKGQQPTTTTTRPRPTTTTTARPRPTTTTTPRRTTTTTQAPTTTTTQAPGIAVSVDADATAGPDGATVDSDAPATRTPPRWRGWGAGGGLPPVAVPPAVTPPSLPGSSGAGLPEPISDGIREACAQIGTALAGVDGIDSATVGVACMAVASGDPTLLAVVASNPSMLCGPLADAIAKAVPAHDATTYASACATALAHAAPITDAAAAAITQVTGALP